MTQHRYRLSNQTSSRTLVSCYKAVQFTNSSSRSQHLAENEKRIAAHWCKWLLAAADRLLPASGREPFCSDLGREGRIFSLRLRCRNCKLVMKEYFQCLVKPWQLGNKRNCGKKRKSSWIHRTNRVVPHRLQRHSRLSSDGFPAQSRDSRIDSVPLFNPLSGLFRDSQEACGYLISHFISRVENSHQTEQL